MEKKRGPGHDKVGPKYRERIVDGLRFATNDSSSLADRCRYLRKRGVSASDRSMQSWLKDAGSDAVPSTPYLIEIAENLGISLDWLLLRSGSQVHRIEREQILDAECLEETALPRIRGSALAKLDPSLDWLVPDGEELTDLMTELLVGHVKRQFQALLTMEQRQRTEANRFRRTVGDALVNSS